MQYPHVQKFEYRMDGSSAEEASRLSMMFTQTQTSNLFNSRVFEFQEP